MQWQLARGVLKNSYSNSFPCKPPCWSPLRTTLGNVLVFILRSAIYSVVLNDRNVSKATRKKVFLKNGLDKIVKSHLISFPIAEMFYEHSKLLFCVLTEGHHLQMLNILNTKV